MANENKILSPPAFVINLCFAIGQLSSAHTKGHFIGMGADLPSVYVKLIGPLRWPRSASTKGNFE